MKTMNSTNLGSLSDYFSSVKEKLSRTLIDDMADLLIKISHPDSGCVIEAVLQLLPDQKMSALAAFCIGNDNSEEAQTIAASMMIRLAARQNFEFDDTNHFVGSCKNFLLLVNLESLRRKGYMEYQWKRDMFSDEDDPMSFTKLTEAGKEYTQKEFLKMYDGTGKPVQ